MLLVTSSLIRVGVFPATRYPRHIAMKGAWVDTKWISNLLASIEENQPPSNGKEREEKLPGNRHKERTQ